MSLTRRSLIAGAAAATAGVAASSSLAHAARPPHNDQGVPVPNFSIYRGDENPITFWSAQDLANYIQLISGYTPPVIVPPAAPPGGHVIYFGRNNPAAAAAGIDFDSLGEDGFALRPVGSNSVLIAGATDRGNLNGLYYVVDRIFGAKWWAPGATHLPHLPNLRIRQADFTGDHVPRFDYRQIMNKDSINPVYQHQNLLNGRARQISPGLTVPGQVNTWSEMIAGYDPNHEGWTVWFILTDILPDYLHGGQALLMDPAARAAAIERVTARLQSNIAQGFPPVIQIEQADTSWIADAASTAFAAQHGNALSACQIDFLNEVLAGVQQTLPQARFSTLAYQWSYQPPTNLAVNSDIVVTVCPEVADLAQPLTSGSNAGIGTVLSGWGTQCENLAVWAYTTNFLNYIQPLPTWTAELESIAELASFPEVKGYMAQSAFNHTGSEFSFLRTWCSARMLWDPTLNPAAVIDEFVAGYYGAAGPHIRNYLHLLEGAVAASGAKVALRHSVGATYFTPAVMKQADDLMIAAAAAVAGDPALAQRVAAVRLGVDYVILMRRAEYAQALPTWDQDTPARLTRFPAEIAAAGMSGYNETGSGPTELANMVAVERTAATQPASINPGDEWIDFPDYTLVVASAGSHATDSLASDSAAIRVDSSVYEWTVQLPLASLPATGTWRLVACLRITPSTGSSTALAAEVGVYTYGTYPVPPADVLLTAGDLADGQYHEIELPGTYVSDALKMLWIAPKANPDVQWLYVDRVYAVRVS